MMTHYEDVIKEFQKKRIAKESETRQAKQERISELMRLAQEADEDMKKRRRRRRNIS